LIDDPIRRHKDMRSADWFEAVANARGTNELCTPTEDRPDVAKAALALLAPQVIANP
jgi:hypothetical protein